MTRTADVVVIGAGIAGLSTAASLAPACSVVVLETETLPAQHATGRSAAVFIPSYGPPAVRRLTRASRLWFETGAEGDADTALLTSRPVVFVADDHHVPRLEQLVVSMGEAGGTLHPLTASEVRERCPAMHPDWVVAGAEDRDASDLDVAAIVAVFRRRLAASGATLSLGAPAQRIERSRTGWTVHTGDGSAVSCGRIVNAAGAWVDDVARMAGVEPLGFQPRRRTIGIGVPTGAETVGSALVAHADEQFYFGAEAGGVLFSPADETLSPPCDARPEEIDVALAMERINAATTLGLRSVTTTWAGLRTFGPGGSLVIGAAPADDTFVWCGGQGGYGIQTAPAAGRVTAAVVRGDALPADLADTGLTLADLAPQRSS